MTAAVNQTNMQSLHTPAGNLPLRETVTYPNGGRSYFY